MKSTVNLFLAGALVVGVSVHAGDVDGNAVLGSVIGAAAGSAIGSATGGKEGAVIGGGIGGAIGAAAGSRQGSGQASGRVIVDERVVSGQNMMIIDDRHDNGRHRGHYKQPHKHKHNHGRH